MISWLCHARIMTCHNGKPLLGSQAAHFYAALIAVRWHLLMLTSARCGLFIYIHTYEKSCWLHYVFIHFEVNCTNLIWFCFLLSCFWYLKYRTFNPHSFMDICFVSIYLCRYIENTNDNEFGIVAISIIMHVSIHHHVWKMCCCYSVPQNDSVKEKLSCL